jgi:ketosteroid isomerase-like protein
MKIRKPFFWVLISFYTLISCNSSKSSEIVTLSKEDQLKEINAFIDKQWNFMTNSSIEEAKNTFYDEMTLIGTDKAEYYTSWSAMKASIEAQTQIIDPKFEQKNRRLFVSDDGTMASYTEIIDFSFSVDGSTNSVKDVRSSGVIKKIDGEWKIVQIHTSVGVEGQAVNY